MSGDVSISNTGVAAIGSGVIVNADVNASAAIAGTKISPDFGSQNIVTTGTASEASLNITGTAGSGFIKITEQNATPATPTSALVLSADSSNRLMILGSDGFAHKIAHGGTASRVYTLPDLTGTFLLDTSTFAANTFIANNTASTAAPTSQKFISKNLATYSSTVTWVGTTAPSGSTTFQYGFQQIGNRVHYWIGLKYSVAGASLSSVALEFPSDFPAMVEPMGLTAASEKLWGSNSFMDSASTGSPGVCRSWIRRNSGDTAYEVVVQTGSGTINALIVWAQGSYFTS
jgi:hypothetical protein